MWPLTGFRASIHRYLSEGPSLQSMSVSEAWGCWDWHHDGISPKPGAPMEGLGPDKTRKFRMQVLSGVSEACLVLSSTDRLNNKVQIKSCY